MDVDREEEEQWFDPMEDVDNFNSILVRGFADNMDNSEIFDILVDQGCNVTDMEDMVLSSTDNVNCRMISGVAKEVLQDIWKKIDNKPIGTDNKRVHVSTLLTATPVKQAATTVNNSPTIEDPPPPPPPSHSEEPLEERPPSTGETMTPTIDIEENDTQSTQIQEGSVPAAGGSGVGEKEKPVPAPVAGGADATPSQAYPPGLSPTEIAKHQKRQKKKERKMKRKEEKEAKKARQDELLMMKKGATPFKSQFARRLSIGEMRTSVGTDVVNEMDVDLSLIHI